MTRPAPGWQLLLADLSLILFLVALASVDEANGRPGAPSPDVAAHPAIAAAQALYRPGEGSPTMTQWLAAQPHDPRATLTIFARHSGRDEAVIWSRARELAGAADRAGYAVRVVVTEGRESDLYASLAYDTQRS